jgi:hypothetical protein
MASSSSAAVTAGGGTAELSAAGNFKTRPSVAIVVFGENPYAEFQWQPARDRHGCLDLLHTMKS